MQITSNCVTRQKERLVMTALYFTTTYNNFSPKKLPDWPL